MTLKPKAVIRTGLLFSKNIGQWHKPLGYTNANLYRTLSITILLFTSPTQSPWICWCEEAVWIEPE